MKPIIYWIIGIALWIALLFDRGVFGAELSPDDVPEYRFDTVGEVADVIRDLMSPAPRRRLYHDHEFRRTFAGEIVAAAERHDVPELLPVVQFYEESSFKVSALAFDRPTVGIGQIHRDGIAAAGCDLSTRAGQVDCSIRFLRFCFDHCRTRHGERPDVRDEWRSALIAYATRGFCFSKNPRVIQSADRRVRKWQKYEIQRERIRDELISDLEYYRQ